MPAAEESDGTPIGVLGLWHLGSVTAACLAQAGNPVVGVDPDANVVEQLTRGHPLVSEPGLVELIEANSERLQFSCDPSALAGARRAWVTFDTPVDDEDDADVEWVLSHTVELLAPVARGALVIVSSQLPVGSVAQLQGRCVARYGDRGLRFACVPENLRLGAAVQSFCAPDRIVAGVSDEADRNELADLLAPFASHVEWMRVESAEMTKHALNGFLATSVAFINEVAAVCESVGADAAEVSRGLKSERRIGPRAYLAPGEAFAGGTLARDIGYLRSLAARHELPAHVFTGVADGNAAHRAWTRRKLLRLLETSSVETRTPADATVALWGLTYKPGTDTLRRSSAVELARWLLDSGAAVRAYDPMISELAAGVADGVQLCASALDAATDADVLVVCTAWPQYAELTGDEILGALARHPIIIDPAGTLRGAIGSRSDVDYACVGSVSPVEVTPRSQLSDEVRPR
jgi:UDPglucose 6-dehydrogenase